MYRSTEKFHHCELLAQYYSSTEAPRIESVAARETVTMPKLKSHRRRPTRAFSVKHFLSAEGIRCHTGKQHSPCKGKLSRCGEDGAEVTAPTLTYRLDCPWAVTCKDREGRVGKGTSTFPKQAGGHETLFTILSHVLEQIVLHTQEKPDSSSGVRKTDAAVAFCPFPELKNVKHFPGTLGFVSFSCLCLMP